jgi:hypothetical protein
VPCDVTASGLTSAGMGGACCAPGGPLFHLSLAPPSPTFFPIKPDSCDRYGQLASVTAPIYFNYGDILLAQAQSSNDALGGPAEEPRGEEEEEEEEDEDGEGEGGKGEGEEGGAKAPPAPPAEEDLTTEEAKEENITDMQIAFECLDVARVIYTRDKEAGKATDIHLARVHLRLGDYFSESDDFLEAIKEYRESLTLYGSKLKPHDKCVRQQWCHSLHLPCLCVVFPPYFLPSPPPCLPPPPPLPPPLPSPSSHTHPGA